MKKPFILLLLVFVSSLCIISCKSDLEDKKKEIRKITQPISDNTKKQPAGKLPPINRLQKADNTTRASISTVNGTPAKKIKRPLVVNTNLEIVGTAIDMPAEAVAAGVYIQVGKKHFLANYGQKRVGLTRQLKNKKLLKSGFRINIPKNKLEKGVQTISLKVVSRDRKTYYLKKDLVKIKVE